MRRGESVNDERQRQERRAKAGMLRAAGKTYREIAAALGVDVRTAWRDLGAIHKDIRKPGADAMQAEREFDLDTIERCITGLADDAEAGDAQAANAIRGLLDRKAKLLGLDAPAKTQAVEPDDIAKMSSQQKLEAHEKAAAELREEIANGKESNGFH